MNVKDFKPRPPLLHCGFNQRPSNVHMLEYFFMLGTWDALKRSLKLAPLKPCVEAHLGGQESITQFQFSIVAPDSDKL